MKKLIPIILAVAMLFSACSAAPAAAVKTEDFKTNYKYIFVHGLSGWGSYDTANKFLKYWGMRNGDLLAYLNEQGFDCYSASVDPHGSAWDRACELYAQLTGSVVDYGKEHSERCNHERYGTDYSKKPLIEKWDAENKINLLGHSFGGATVRMLSELMANGSEAEREATEESELSPLFTGGKADWIYSITALAAPMNGTTAYDVDSDAEVGVGMKAKLLNGLTSMMSAANAEDEDGRVDYDNANFDMLIDNAAKMNDNITTLENVYYFSVPCDSVIEAEDGTYYPDESKTELLFIKASTLMGKLTEVTPEGFEVDEKWLMNDGLVNTISATAPFNAPQMDFDAENIQKGIWNVMPVYDGDHMSLQGGLFKKNDVREFYIEHLTMINGLEE